MRLQVLGGVIAGAAMLAAPAAARELVFFPTPATPLSTSPPLTGAELSFPNVFHPPVESHELIDVGLDESGSVVGVKVTQRLVLHQTADYRLTIPAPVLDVESAAGSESLPGQRRGAILWQGFASGRRILAARARLDPRAASSLPLRVRVSGLRRRAGRFDIAIRLHNATQISVTSFSGDGDRPTLAKILDTLRRDPGGSTLGRGTYVAVTRLTRKVRVTVDAPLRVVGRLRVGGGSIATGKLSFAAELGGGKPLDRMVHLRGDAMGPGLPMLTLTVEPRVPAGELRPPAGRTWVEAIGLDRRLNGRRLLGQALEASLRLARVRQYRTYLANPDLLGAATARYVYSSAPRAAEVRPAPARSNGGGLGPAVIALIAVGAVVGAGGLAVLWAHS